MRSVVVLAAVCLVSGVSGVGCRAVARDPGFLKVVGPASAFEEAGVVPDVEVPPPRARGEPSIRGSLRFARWEFDEITSDIIDDLGTKLGEVDLEDEERKRVEVRIGAGVPEATAFVSLSGEEFFEDDDGDFFGFGLGVEGAVSVVEVGPETSVFVEYELSGSFNTGEGETEVVLLPSLIIVEEDMDLEYLEGIFRAGVGVELPIGLRVSAGVVASVIEGEFEIDGFAGEGDFDGNNAAGYVSARLGVADTPMYLHVELVVGDVEGFMVSGGLAF